MNDSIGEVLGLLESLVDKHILVLIHRTHYMMHLIKHGFTLQRYQSSIAHV